MSKKQSKLDFQDLEKQKALMKIEEELLLKKALNSDDPNAILKAQTYITKNISNREKTDNKSILIDPMDMNGTWGYKNKTASISYDVLRMMAKTHLIKAITSTRKEQVSAFCQPQTNKYDVGFVIRKKDRKYSDKKEVKVTKSDMNTIDKLTEFILNCGSVQNEWHGDAFSTWVGKMVDDSLVLDQATSEIIRNKRGEIVEFLATDGATFRIADSYDDENYQYKEKEIKGYAPSYVQLLDGTIHAEFYPWELMWGIRNPSTDIRLNGYGRSELEDLINTVTSLLNTDKYNSNFFKVGAAPKGILRYKGTMNQTALEDFKRTWMAQISGAGNAHKFPMINADSMDFVPFSGNNKDMEFSKFQEFLIKITCAIYKIDPSEIGFNMNGSSDSKPMFEGNNAARLKYSKDKGLTPLLRHIERWINKYIVSQLDNNFEFKFVGIDGELSYTEDVDLDIKSLSNFMTLNEVRAKRGLPPIKGGDMILNAIFFQQSQSQAQQQQDGGGQEQGADNNLDNVFGEDENPTVNSDNEEDNPFLNGLQDDLDKID